jgi:hypothetical protein
MMNPMTPQDEISINDPKAWEVFYQYMFKLAMEGVFKIKRYDAFDAEFDIEYKNHYERIRFIEWQLEEIFGGLKIPTSYEEFRREIMMYLENEIRRKEEEEKRKEENEKLANEVLNMIKTCLSLDKIKGKVGFEVKSTDIAGYVTIRIEPNS